MNQGGVRSSAEMACVSVISADEDSKARCEISRNDVGLLSTAFGTCLPAEARVQITVIQKKDLEPLALEMLPSETVGDLKRAIQDSWDILVCNQRLFVRSCPVKGNSSTLRECGIADHRVVQLVPELKHRAVSRGVAAIQARRGFHMVSAPGPWRPRGFRTVNLHDVDAAFGRGN